jgi:16S rRNA (uracil1498-N3)-methyltransferase
MNLFYAPDISSDIYSLNEEESRHCRMVLRLREGETVHLTDGKGTLFQAQITDVRAKLVNVAIISRVDGYGKRPYHLHMAVAPTKNIDRFEWFLEKATEIGVDVITPLICEHSERRHLRTDRLEKVITAAVKQSLKAYHPVLNEIVGLKEFLAKENPGQLFMAHLDEEKPVLLQKLYRKGSDVTILVGPEGDFSQAEITAAIQSGYKVVSLGESRLRTETAAIAACHTIGLING